MPHTDQQTGFPQLTRSGVDGLVVRFAPEFSEPANRAALALRAAIAAEGWPGVTETAASLVSTLVRFDPLSGEIAALEARLMALLHSRDWLAAPLPANRRRIILPACFDPAVAPDAPAVADAAGLDLASLAQTLSAAPLRVMTIGFAPGFPYIGTLEPRFDLPRRRELAPQVPLGALCLAVRQLVLFPAASQTGWHHVAQTAARAFEPGRDDPFLFRAGDDIMLRPIPAKALADAAAQPRIEALT